jgi:hypothetical protein
MADGDPVGAAEILQKRPELLHGTWQRVAQAFTMKDPAAGMAWAQGLPEEIQPYAQRSIIGGWAARRKDPASAKAWVEQSILPAATKKELLKQIRQATARK